MDEFSAIKTHIARHIQLSEEEESILLSLIKVRRVRKKQCIVQPEFTCKYRSYIVQGAMRAYLIDQKSQEHTIALAVEDWWISDYYSYIYQEPATLFVEALEDSVLVQIDFQSEQLLMKKIPAFERFLRIITERSYAFLQKRVLSNLSKSAEERYEEFMSKYPDIAKRVPQYALASYLGFSTEFLSKIRNKRVKKS